MNYRHPNFKPSPKPHGSLPQAGVEHRHAWQGAEMLVGLLSDQKDKAEQCGKGFSGQM